MVVSSREVRVAHDHDGGHSLDTYSKIPIKLRLPKFLPEENHIAHFHRKKKNECVVNNKMGNHMHK